MYELSFRYGLGVIMLILAVAIGLVIPQQFWAVAILIACGVMVWRVQKFYDSNFFLIGLGAVSTFMAMYFVAWLISGGYAQVLA